MPDTLPGPLLQSGFRALPSFRLHRLARASERQAEADPPR
jgi:hypothetical protein